MSKFSKSKHIYLPLALLSLGLILSILGYAISSESKSLSGILYYPLVAVLFVIFLGHGAYVLVEIYKEPTVERKMVALCLFLFFVCLITLTFAGVYFDLGLYDSLNTQDKDPVHDRWTSLYFAIVTLTSVGYGDVIPTHEARIFAAMEAVFGYFTSATVIASIVEVYAAAQRKPLEEAADQAAVRDQGDDKD